MSQGFQEVVSKIPCQEQRQDALTDQLRDLIPVANRLGMYDAADFLRDRVDQVEKKEHSS